MTRHYVYCSVNGKGFGVKLWAKNYKQIKEIIDSKYLNCKIVGTSTSYSYLDHFEVVVAIDWDYCKKFETKLYEHAYNLSHPKLGVIRRFVRVKAISEYEAVILARNFFAELGWSATSIDAKCGFDHEYININ